MITAKARAPGMRAVLLVHEEALSRESVRRRMYQMEGMG